MINKDQLTTLGAVALITTGWGVAGVIGTVTTGTIVAAIIFPAGWVSGSLLMAVVLHWAKSALGWLQVLALTLGWAICWPFSLAIGSLVGGLASAVVTLSGGLPEMGPRAFIVGVMFGLILAGTLGGIISGIILRWSQPELSGKRILVIVLGWFVAWGIGGTVSLILSGNIVSPVGWAVAGGIGSGIMFWQLGRAS